MLSPLEIRRRFDRRMLVFQVIMGVLLLLLLGHMASLQWVQHEDYLLQANRNRVNIVPVLPTRGTITDRFGEGLAVNHVSYMVQMIPERVEDMDRTLASVRELLSWNDRQMDAARERILRARSDRPVLLQDKLQWRDVAPLSSRLHHLPGVDIIAGTHRYYPHAELTSHLVGYLSLAGPEDLRDGYLRTEYVGRNGLERAFEEYLHGTLGSQREEVDAHGRRVSVLNRIPPKMGEQLRTSLDVRLQEVASRALGDRTGAVVVLDVQSGEVLTLLSKPGFDTNHFITGLEFEQWQQWLSDRRKPLLNRAIQAAFPPASTLKMIVGLAGLRHHVPLATGTTTCNGQLELADRDLRCWQRKGHGRVNLHKAIVESCDVYFYELGDQLGMQRLREEMQLWGLGEKSGIALSAESRGQVPPPEQQLANGRTRSWYRGETMITAIGQGSTLITPLQMARFAAAIANGGSILKPELKLGSEPEIVRQVDLEPGNLERIRDAMRDVIADPHGTAHYAVGRTAWPIAGKTGTAQVIAIAQDEEEEDQSDQLRHKDHAWFMGYAPFDDPQIAFAIFVEHGGHGGSAAGPVARAIVNELAGRPQPAAQSGEAGKEG